jgi:hypothetical protein
MRRRASATTALALAAIAATVSAQETYLRASGRGLQQAKPDDLFPEGPDMVCWNYAIPGEQGADLTPDQVRLG